jgi:hypothetical protein
LKRIQRAFWGVISQPLTRDNRTPRRGRDGRATAATVARFIKPNDRLDAVERIQIYHRAYWFRLLDSLYDDCPGLRAALGERKFMRLAEAYLAKHPSRSFTLRNLPGRLAAFIRDEPRWTRPHTALCVDVARFEWAQIVVYDEAALPLFTTDDLLDADPASLRLNLQPYLQLLALDYPVDEFVLAVKQQEALLRHDASNMPAQGPAAGAKSRKDRARLPERGRCWLAVHRFEGSLYLKRLEPAAFRILAALRAGRPLDRAIARGVPPARRADEASAAKVQDWFQNWTELGWFCRRDKNTTSNH